MSAIAAAVTVNPHAPAAEPALVVRMLEAMPDRGPEGRRTTAVGPAALGHGLFRVLPEDQPGAQPAVSPDGSVTVVLDGRLDNRDELLSLARTGDTGQCDAAVLAAAIAGAGDRAWARAAGDFAAIAWDQSRRRLQAMRDVFGLRPLHVSVAGDAVYLASELRALAGLVPVTLDEGYFAEHLSGRVTTMTATPLASVSRVRPGHLLTVSTSVTQQDPLVVLGGGLASTRPAADLRDEFLHVLDAAVRVRLRRWGDAGVLLSAGLDSTTVFARARRIDTGVAAFTADQRPGASETAGAAATAALFGAAHHVTAGTARTVDYAGLARHFFAPPPHPSAANGLGVRALAARHGCRTLLSGLGGDEFFSTNAWGCADLLRAGRLGELGRAWRRLRGATEPASASALALATLTPLVPAACRPLARALVRRRRAPAWVHPRWARACGLEDRLRAVPPLTGRSIAERVRLRDVLGGPSVFENEESDRMAVWTGVDDRAPYFDRHLAAFALALPDALVATAPEPKAFVRDACRDFLRRLSNGPWLRSTSSSCSPRHSRRSAGVGSSRTCG